MLPGIDLRLQNVVKALQEVVLPAIPADQRLARDQAMLAIGHIQMFAGQWRHAARYEAASLRKMAKLAEDLLALPGSSVDDVKRVELENLLVRASAADPADLTETEQLIVNLGKVIDAVIMESGRPGTMPPDLVDVVLAYAEAQSHRERVWFSATKLDPDVGELEDIAAMLAGSGRTGPGT